MMNAMMAPAVRGALLAAIFAALIGGAGTVVAAERILRVTDRKVLSLDSVVDDLLQVRLVFVGEAHGQLSHHEAQVAVARRLRDRGADVALGLEVFQAGNQSVLDEWVAGKTGLSPFVARYYENWKYPWTIYQPIFLFARDRKVPLVGLNVPEDLVKRVSREGPGALDPETAAAVGGIACVVDDAYRQFIARILSDHVRGTEAFERFCSAQVFWDAAMAVRVLRHLGEHPGRTMVVLAGKGHAWKPGIPAQIRRRAGPEFRVILPAMPGLVDPATVTAADADYVWLFP
jgi:uncharacterized iron-regulated protein